MKWAEDKDAAQCQQCNQPFSLARRKVHVVVLTSLCLLLMLLLFFCVCLSKLKQVTVCVMSPFDPELLLSAVFDS